MEIIGEWITKDGGVVTLVKRDTGFSVEHVNLRLRKKGDVPCVSMLEVSKCLRRYGIDIQDRR